MNTLYRQGTHALEYITYVVIFSDGNGGIVVSQKSRSEYGSFVPRDKISIVAGETSAELNIAIADVTRGYFEPEGESYDLLDTDVKRELHGHIREANADLESKLSYLKEVIA
jgi:hypothetical protein